MYNYLQAFISLFCIMNPLVSVTMYLSLTSGMDYAQKRSILTVCGITVFTILIICLFIGQKAMVLLGIHPYALEMAGGLIVLLIGITTILKDTKTIEPKKNNFDINNALKIGVSPLALPMIVGPGSMVMVMLYSQESPSIASKLILSGIILIVTISVILVISISDVISKIMGDLGVLVMTKVMGLLLTAIAVEMIISGFKDVVPVILGH